MNITIEQLCQMMPHCSFTRAKQMLAANNAAMARVEINTRRRAAAWIASLGHETMDFLYMEEIASGEKYEGRLDLGNYQEGDGKRFKGRGPIQITGRANYTAFAKWSGVDCVNEPELLEDPDNGFLATAWYWDSRKLNKPADAGDFLLVSTRINGRRADGYPNGWADRLARYERAMKVLA